MVHRPNIRNDLCFVLMPLSDPFLGYYEKLIKPAARVVGLEAIQSKEIYGTKAIIRDIWEHIWSARVIIADVTGKNPNVNYELGLCHALNVPTVLMSRSVEDIPFDYRHRRAVLYDTNNADWTEKLRADLEETLRRAVQDQHDPGELRWPYEVSKEILSEQARRIFTPEHSWHAALAGANLARAFIETAYGPQGRFASLHDQALHRDTQTRSGAALARLISAEDEIEQKGVQAITSAMTQVADQCRDGTKTAGLLTYHIIAEARSAANFTPTRRIFDGIEMAFTAARSKLSDARPSTSADLLAAATTASQSTEIGELIVKATECGASQVTVDFSNNEGHSLERSEGIKLPSGLLDDAFANAPGEHAARLEKSLVLVSTDPMTSMPGLIALLERVAEGSSPITFFAPSFGDDVRSMLAVNTQRHTIQCTATELPGPDQWQRDFAEDIAAFTGATILSEKRGTHLAHAALDALGKAELVIMDEQSTSITGGAGSSDAVQHRIRSLTARVESSPPNLRPAMEDRIARLSGGLSIIYIGGRTLHERLDNKYRADSALATAASAMTTGTVDGGGLFLRTIAEQLKPSEDKEVSAGLEIARKAMLAPYRIIEESRNLHRNLAPPMDAAGILSKALDVAAAKAIEFLSVGAWYKKHPS